MLALGSCLSNSMNLSFDSITTKPALKINQPLQTYLSSRHALFAIRILHAIHKPRSRLSFPMPWEQRIRSPVDYKRGLASLRRITFPFSFRLCASSPTLTGKLITPSNVERLAMLAWLQFAMQWPCVNFPDCRGATPKPPSATLFKWSYRVANPCNETRLVC